MSTLDICDRVMVIVDGRLAAFDTTALPAARTPTTARLGARRRDRRRTALSGELEPVPRDERLDRRGDWLARRACGRRSPTSSSSGTPRAARRRCTRCSAPPADLHARRQGAVVLRRGAARAHPAAPGRDARRRSRSTRRCSPARARAARRRGVARCTCGRTPPRARIAAVQPDARIIAILREPASFLRSLHLQFVRDLRRDRDGPAHGARARAGAGARAGEIPRYTYWPQALLYSEHVRYVEQLRRYHDAVRARADAGADLRRLPRRQRRRRCARCCASWSVDDTRPIEAVEANPTVRVRSQRLHELVHAVSRRARPALARG